MSDQGLTALDVENYIRKTINNGTFWTNFESYWNDQKEIMPKDQWEKEKKEARKSVDRQIQQAINERS